MIDKYNYICIISYKLSQRIIIIFIGMSGYDSKQKDIDLALCS